MAVADKTISFRAPQDFAERLDHARSVLHAFHATHERTEIDSWLVGEFDMALMRRLSALSDATSQGAFVRAVMEALVGATERVERELQRMDAYRAFSDHDSEGDEVRKAALTAAAQNWK